jgi:hypothetical protein
MNQLSPQPPTVFEQLERNSAQSPDIDLKKFALTIGAVAALGTLSQSVASPERAVASSTPTEVATTNLKQEQGVYLRDAYELPAFELPGFDREVSRKQEMELANSTVKILRKLKNPGQYDHAGWLETCTGNIIKLSGYKGPEIIISTAAHCDSTTGKKSGANFNTAFAPAVDLLDSSLYDFAIADPMENNIDTPKTVIARVKRMSVNQRGADITFMSAEPTDERQPGQNARLIKSIKPLKIKTNNNPILGQEVALASAPAAANNRLIKDKGIYAGMYTLYNEFGKPRKVAIVAINPFSPEEDVCNFGGSGSGAIMADGTTLSSLSIRVNTGYPNHELQYNDVYSYDSEGNLKTSNPSSFKAKVERKLRVDLSSYSTICGYSVATNKTFGRMMKGFTLKPPPNAQTTPQEAVGFNSGK